MDARLVVLLFTADREPYATRRRNNAATIEFWKALAPTFLVGASPDIQSPIVETRGGEQWLLTPGEDSWSALPRKTWWALGWAVAQGYTHIVKVDDDVVVHDTPRAGLVIAAAVLDGVRHAAVNLWQFRPGDVHTYHTGRLEPWHPWSGKTEDAGGMLLACGELYFLSREAAERVRDAKDAFFDGIPLEDVQVTKAVGGRPARLPIRITEARWD